MSRVLRLRRGSTAETSAFTGKLAEVTVDTDTFSLVVHDNVTPGGYRIATESYVESNKAVTSIGSTAPSQDVTEGSMWFDSVSGRLYVRYSNVWIDANPTVENNTIGNLLIDDTTIRTTDNANLYLSPNGSGVVISNITGTLTGNVTGNVTGSISGSAATVRTAAQPNITSVGTLTALTVSTPIVGDITGRANTANTANAANTANTVTTAAQPNITSVGTLSSLTVSANVTAGNVKTNDYYNSSGPGLVMHGNVIPASNVAYNLGAPGNEWNSLYVSNNTIYLGGIALSIDNTNNLTVDGNPVGSGALAPSSNAPGSASEGQLWFDVEDGHLYVRYSNVWVDTTIAGSGGGTLWTNPANGCLRAELSGTGFQAYTTASHLDLQDGGIWNIGSYQNSTSIGNDQFSNQHDLSLRSGDATFITTNLRENGNHQWKFDTDGVLNFPNNNGQIGQLSPPYTGLEFRTGSGADWIGISYGEINDNNTSYFYFDKDGSDYTTADHRAHLQIKNPAHDGHVEWLFESDGKLTAPGNLVIAGNASLMGGNGALIQSADNLPLLALTSGTDGGIVSFWAEDVGDLLNSNIAAVYANPTSGSGIVRIAVGQNGSPGPNLWDFGTDGKLTLPAGGDIRDRTSNISRLKTRIGDTYAPGAFQQLIVARDEGTLITIAGGVSLFRLPQLTAALLGAEFEFYLSADAGQVRIQSFYTDVRSTTDKFVGSVFVGVDNATTGRLHTATSYVADANYLFLGQHHAKAGSYIKFKAIAFDTVGTWLVQGQCVGDAVNTTPNGQSYIFQNYYD